ncbi:MAG: hypothetical protein ACLR8Y_02300 [Alistipes indistinctus]
MKNSAVRKALESGTHRSMRCTALFHLKACGIQEIRRSHGEFLEMQIQTILVAVRKTTNWNN